MRIFFIIITMLAAVFAQWGFSSWNIGGIPPPFIPAVVFFWFLKIKLPSRLWFAILLGLIFDSFRTFPFGTYLFVFFLESLLVEVLRASFSNPRSSLTRGVSMGIMLVLFFSMVPVATFLVAWLGGFATTKVLLLPTLVGTLLWTGIFTFIFTAALKFFNMYIRKV